MIIALIDRFKLISQMPKGCRVAEIGVRDGDNAAVILEKTRPESLHLIDPWIHQQDPLYQNDTTANVTDEEQEARFQLVCSKFSKSIDIGQTIVVRKTLKDACNDIPDGFFDWVFLDARHHYEAVYEDLCLLDKKVREDGVIVGHDFTEHRDAESMNFGVIGAVGAFLKRMNYELTVMNITYPTLNQNNYPAYFISKSPNSQISKTLINTLFENEIPLVEIPASLALAFQYRRVEGKNLPTFELQ